MIATEKMLFERVEFEIHKEIRKLGLKKLEPLVKLGCSTELQDEIQIDIVPKGNQNTSYSIRLSDFETRELNKRLGDISLAVAQVADKYELESLRNKEDCNYSYIIRRK